MLHIDDTVTDFTAPTDGGELFHLSSLSAESWLVLYFYPKDDTPGCTREALDFTTRLQDFTALHTHVMGVSKDSVTKHVKFKKKHALGITLLSDEDKTLCTLFGTWMEKSLYGRKYMGIDRATFIIDPDRKIRHVWHKVRVKGHVDDVLCTLKQLQAS